MCELKCRKRSYDGRSNVSFDNNFKFTVHSLLADHLRQHRRPVKRRVRTQSTIVCLQKGLKGNAIGAPNGDCANSYAFVSICLHHRFSFAHSTSIFTAFSSSFYSIYCKCPPNTEQSYGSCGYTVSTRTALCTIHTMQYAYVRPSAYVRVRNIKHFRPEMGDHVCSRCAHVFAKLKAVKMLNYHVF